MQGQVLGRYRLIERIGAGGMGEVWRARDDSLGRDVALKMLSAATAGDPERRKRFEREARAVAGLQHPNIVTIHSIEDDGGVYFLTMELVKGKTLGELVPAGGFPLERFFELSIPLADAVHAAHEQGVIHRDLKPGNVMVDETGRLRVLDFGLAKLTATTDTGDELTVSLRDASTKQGQILGTVAYMSPEQAEGKPLDRRSDIFSLGVVLYEMATGRRPFQGDTPLSTLSAILRETPPTITSLRPLPRHLARVIQRCLEKNPDRRYQTARDVCNELEGLKKEVESGEIEVAPSSDSALGMAPVVAAPRRRTWPWIAAAAVLALAFATWAVLSNRGPREQRTLETRPLTGAAGVEYVGSWSPDGSFFAYSHAARGPLDIFVQPTAGGDPICLVESPADDALPAWSPDNRWIAFMSNREQTIGIYAIPPLGGTIRKLADTGLHGLNFEVDYAMGPAPWSPDGQRIVFSQKREGKIAAWMLELATGAETQLTRPGGGEYDAMPTWSPDGKQIAFLRFAAEVATLWIVPASGGEARPIPNAGAAASGAGPGTTNFIVGLSPDGRDVVIVSDRLGGIRNLWAVSVSSGAMRQLSSGSIDVGGAAVGRDGRILYSDFSHQTDLYVQHLDGGEAKRLTFHTQSNFGAQYSPDGGRLAYNSDRTGDTEVWVLDIGSGKERQITDHAAEDYMPSWSPDGRQIVFISTRTGAARLWMAPADGGAAQQVGGPDGASLPRFAPDGGGIGFLAGSEEGTALWLMDVGGGEVRKLLTGVLAYDWFRDRDHVIYTPSDHPTELRAVDLRSGRETVIVDEPNMEPAVAPDGSALSYCTARSHFNMNLQLLRLQMGDDGLPRAAGPPQVLAAGEGLWHVHNGGFTPDGQSVIYTRDTDTGDVYVLEGAF